MSERADDDRVPVLSGAADALERAVFGRYESAYRWAVRLLWAAVAVLAFVHAARYLGAGPGLSPGAAASLDFVTSVAVTLLLVIGALQVVLVARGVQRRREAVAASAEALEASAAAVEDAAADVETAADDVEAERAVERAVDAKETAEAVEETAEAVRSELSTDDEDVEPAGDGSTGP